MLNYLFILLIVQSKIHNQWIDSYNRQNGLLQDIVSNYEILLKGEERKFELGESSIFLVNSREKFNSCPLKGKQTRKQLL